MKELDNQDLFKQDAQLIANYLITEQLNKGDLEESDPQILAI